MQNFDNIHPELGDSCIVKIVENDNSLGSHRASFKITVTTVVDYLRLDINAIAGNASKSMNPREKLTHSTLSEGIIDVFKPLGT